MLSRYSRFLLNHCVYEPLSKFGYHYFIPRFKGEHFDAEEWAELFLKGGARFAGPIGEYHDGFAMWDSDVTPFNAKNMGPRRDIVGELAKAIRGKGMKLFISLHHEKHYTNVERIRSEWSAANPKYAKLYGYTMPREEWQKMWYDKCIEVVDKYRPDIIYHDDWLEEVDQENLKKYLAHFFTEGEKRGQEVIVTYKGEDIPTSVGMLDHENTSPDTIAKEPFLCDFSIGTGTTLSWGYVDGMKVRESKEVIHTLIQAVACNGQMILSLSPKANGIIPDNQRQVVIEVGCWLWTFGEAIYETRPFKVSGETTGKKSVSYTRKGNTVYAIFLDWPGTDTWIELSKLTPASLEGDVQGVNLLGLKKIEECTFNMKENLQVKIPGGTRLPHDAAQVLRIELK